MKLTEFMDILETQDNMDEDTLLGYLEVLDERSWEALENHFGGTRYAITEALCEIFVAREHGFLH